jgi:hypothetical protein
MRPLLLGLACVVLFAGSVGAAEPVRWEYLVLPQVDLLAKADAAAPNRIQAALNVLGAEGWELVAIDPNADPNNRPTVPGKSLHYFFKRRK